MPGDPTSSPVGVLLFYFLLYPQARSIRQKEQTKTQPNAVVQLVNPKVNQVQSNNQAVRPPTHGAQAPSEGVQVQVSQATAAASGSVRQQKKSVDVVNVEEAEEEAERKKDRKTRLRLILGLSIGLGVPLLILLLWFACIVGQSMGKRTDDVVKPKAAIHPAPAYNLNTNEQTGYGNLMLLSPSASEMGGPINMFQPATEWYPPLITGAAKNENPYNTAAAPAAAVVVQMPTGYASKRRTSTKPKIMAPRNDPSSMIHSSTSTVAVNNNLMTFAQSSDASTFSSNSNGTLGGGGTKTVSKGDPTMTTTATNKSVVPPSDGSIVNNREFANSYSERDESFQVSRIQIPDLSAVTASNYSVFAERDLNKLNDVIFSNPGQSRAYGLQKGKM